jgi:hypothetical protein
MGLEEGRREPLRIVLDVEQGVEPISGTIASGSDPAEPFAGVMQLVAALDRLRGDEPEQQLAGVENELGDWGRRAR